MTASAKFVKLATRLSVRIARAMPALTVVEASDAGRDLAQAVSRLLALMGPGPDQARAVPADEVYAVRHHVLSLAYRLRNLVMDRDDYDPLIAVFFGGVILQPGAGRDADGSALLDSPLETFGRRPYTPRDLKISDIFRAQFEGEHGLTAGGEQ